MTSLLLAHAVDEAFDRLAKLYGREFTGKFDDDIAAVKVQWLRELAPLPRVLDSVAWALKNLPERCPNAIQFRNLCRLAPDPQRLAMEHNSAPVRGPTPEELAALFGLRDDIQAGTLLSKPSKQWAFDLLDRAAVDWRDRHGRPISKCAQRMAREVAGPDYVPRETASQITGMTPTAVIVDDFDAYDSGDDWPQPPGMLAAHGSTSC